MILDIFKNTWNHRLTQDFHLNIRMDRIFNHDPASCRRLCEQGTRIKNISTKTSISPPPCFKTFILIIYTSKNEFCQAENSKPIDSFSLHNIYKCYTSHVVRPIGIQYIYSGLLTGILCIKHSIYHKVLLNPYLAHSFYCTSRAN